MNFMDFLENMDTGSFDFGSVMDAAGMAGGGSTGGWDYWAKAIQDGVIGQSAGFDAVKQNEEMSPLGMEARGDASGLSNTGTKGSYVYNLEGDVPFLNSMNEAFVNKRQSDPILAAETQKAQNNASGSNASLDKALNEDARKIAGVSEGGATPQLPKTKGYATDTSFNSMMDAFGDMHLPLDNPKSREESFGKKKKDNKGLNITISNGQLGQASDAGSNLGSSLGGMWGSSASGLNTADATDNDWWLNMFGRYY